MKQKNYIIVAAVLTCALFIGAYSINNQLQLTEKPYLADPNAMLAPDVPTTIEGHLLRETEYAPYSVGIAEVVSTKPFRQSIEVEFVINEGILGIDSDTTIIYYQLPEYEPEVGQQFFLFAQKLNNFAYPENAYNGLPDMLYSIDSKGKLSSVSQYGQNMLNSSNNTVDKMRDYVLSAVATAPQKWDVTDEKDKKVKDNYKSIKELCDASDLIVKATIVDTDQPNEAVVIVGLSVSETLKGSGLDETIKYLLPTDVPVTAGEEYYLFFVEQNPGEYLPAARQGVVIPASDTKKAEQIIKALGK